MKKTPLIQYYAPLVLLALAVILGASSPAYATTGGAALDDFCPAMNGIVERMVLCIQSKMLTTAYVFIFFIYPYFYWAIGAFLTLSVIFFGVSMLMPMIEKPGRDTMIFILKIGCVILFTTNMEMVLHWFVGYPSEWTADTRGGILGNLVDIVTQFTLFDFGPNELGCPSGVNVWQRIDCILDLIVGVNTPESLTDGMLAFFFHNFFVGSVGVVIFLLGIWMLFSFLMMLLGAIQTYLMAVMMICLLVIVGLLFCPLIMFKNTYDIFQRWVKMLIANVIIPVVLFAYANVMLSAFDVVLYSGEHSVFRTFAGEAVDDEYFSIQAYMYDNGLVEEVEDKGIIHDQRAATRFTTPQGQTIGGEVDQFAHYSDDETSLLPQPGTLAEFPIAIPMQRIDYDAAAIKVGAASGPDLLQAVLASMIMMALVSYILIALMKFVPLLAQELAGGVSETPRIAQVAMDDMPLVGNSSGGGLGVADGFRKRMGGMVAKR